MDELFIIACTKCAASFDNKEDRNTHLLEIHQATKKQLGRNLDKPLISEGERLRKRAAISQKSRMKKKAEKERLNSVVVEEGRWDSSKPSATGLLSSVNGVLQNPTITEVENDSDSGDEETTTQKDKSTENPNSRPEHLDLDMYTPPWVGYRNQIPPAFLNSIDFLNPYMLAYLHFGFPEKDLQFLKTRKQILDLRKKPQIKYYAYGFSNACRLWEEGIESLFTCDNDVSYIAAEELAREYRNFIQEKMSAEELLDWKRYKETFLHNYYNEAPKNLFRQKRC